MVNTLKKFVIGMCFAVSVTVLAGAADTFAADKAETVHKNIVEQYKADLEKAIAEEKDARKAVDDEYRYKKLLQNKYGNNFKVAELYVRAVADQSRGLDVNSIKEAQKKAGEAAEYYAYWYNFNNTFKTQADKDAFDAYFDYPAEEEEAEDPEGSFEEWQKRQNEYNEMFKDAPQAPFGWDYDEETGDYSNPNFNVEALEKAREAVFGDKD